jgi:hypothetical protein
MAEFSSNGLRTSRCVAAMAMGLVVWAANTPARAESEEAAPTQTNASATVQEPAGVMVPGMAKHSPYRAIKITEKAKKQYLVMWGVDKLRVSSTSSGNLIRFSYHVAAPELAKPLAEKSATPYLYGQASRALLQVPVMDKVGPLRQSAPPVAGQEYWMVFSNKGNLVKVGDRVNVVIGAFHADSLMVE